MPVNLLLSVALLGVFHRVWTVKFGVLIFVVFWVGYLVEVLGVHTGFIFGSYRYGHALGFKVADVPPMIGVNWVMLIYCTGIASQGLSSNIWVRTSVGALFMVLLDILIEPMAVRHDMWVWLSPDIPLQNYFAWYVVSWGLLYGFHSLHQEKSNPIAIPLYLIQLLFFLVFWVIEQGVAGMS
ncbi:MAG: hypothetical protein OHK0039_06160 [Bacteroidia bacterium]